MRIGEDVTSPILLRRKLASHLRRIREQRALTIAEVATDLCCSTSKLSRLETAQVTAALSDVRALLEIYEIDGSERETLIQLARDARRREAWRRDYSDLPNLRELVDLERAATSIQSAQTIVVPGLLQTEEYARLIITISLAHLKTQTIERLVRLRISRQSILQRADPPSMEVVLDESAIRRLDGRPDLQCKQVRHLVEAARMRNVTLQIIPFRVGPHDGMIGPFSIFRFLDDADVVYLEHFPRDSYIEDPRAMCYVERFKHLRGIALDPEDSLTFLDDIVRKV
jgi:transcriptional regulator with XRE-family HTH domain